MPLGAWSVEQTSQQAAGKGAVKSKLTMRLLRLCGEMRGGPPLRLAIEQPSLNLTSCGFLTLDGKDLVISTHADATPTPKSEQTRRGQWIEVVLFLDS